MKNMAKQYRGAYKEKGRATFDVEPKVWHDRNALVDEVNTRLTNGQFDAAEIWVRDSLYRVEPTIREYTDDNAQHVETPDDAT